MQKEFSLKNQRPSGQNVGLRTILSTQNVQKATQPRSDGTAYFLIESNILIKIKGLPIAQGVPHNFIHRKCEQEHARSRVRKYAEIRVITGARILRTGKISI